MLVIHSGWAPLIRLMLIDCKLFTLLALGVNIPRFDFGVIVSASGRDRYNGCPSKLQIFAYETVTEKAHFV